MSNLAILVDVEPEDLEQILVKTARLTEENHKILRRMQRAERRAVFMRVLQWLIIIGSFVVLYYLIQPYIAEVQALTESYRNVLDSKPTDGKSYEAVQKFLDNFDIKDKVDSTNTEGDSSGAEGGGVDKTQ